MVTKRTHPMKQKISFVMALAAFTILLPAAAMAHCDAVNGPVATAARESLATGAFGKTAIWVDEAQEKELKQIFEQSLKVYRGGDEDARHLATHYFMETAVRLHRAAEGFPYEGLKPEQPLPADVEAAEKALENGNLNPVLEMLNASMKKETERLYHDAIAAKKNKDQSVSAGRRWTDAYVKYIIYIHGLHQTITGGPAHGIGETGGKAAHGH